MALKAGLQLGPYEILSPLGKGGMGEVYLARDTRLDRRVAVKVLPDTRVDEESRRRFEREARTISAMNHSNICALHDVGESNGLRYIVMEYIEGETLARRIARSPLPLDQFVEYGMQICSALNAAHKRGVVHRDLKPANVMITAHGVKLLDFGLAREFSSPAPAGEADLATLENPLTRTGVVVGTPNYMSPEQVEGRPVDARSDIFALGAVLFEMATGKKVFPGTNAASVVAAILSSSPARPSELRPELPRGVDLLIRGCLERDPEARWQTAHDVRLQLRNLLETGEGPTVVLPSVPQPVRAGAPRLRAVYYAVAALLIVVAFAVGAYVSPRDVSPDETLYALVATPRGVDVEFESGAPVLAPDEKTIAFVASSREGVRSLWIRKLSEPAAKALSGTEDATFPFWAPDSRWIGYFAEGKLKKVDAVSGVSETICDAPDGRGGSWNRSGTIVFAPFGRDSIYSVAATGGPARKVTTLRAGTRETTHRWPSFLPDGDHFLYLARGDDASAPLATAGVFVGSLSGDPVRQLISVVSNAVYSDAGFILFCREGALRASRLDTRTMTVEANSIPVTQGVAFNYGQSFGAFSVTKRRLVFGASENRPQTNLVWMDRSGRRLGVIGDTADYWTPNLAPDGRSVAIDVTDPETGSGDVWTTDLQRNVQTRLTATPKVNESAPVWSPDGRSLVIRSSEKGPSDLYVRSSGGAQRLIYADSAYKVPTSWSADGRFVLFVSRRATRGVSHSDVWVYSFDDGRASPFLQGPFDDNGPQFSPDSRWIAYFSNESGSHEVYVRRFPEADGVVRISNAGGGMPRWSRDGRTIFYVSPRDQLMAVDVRVVNGQIEAGTPRTLFEFRPRTYIGDSPEYDVTADGERFVVNEIVKESEPPIGLVTGWTGLLPSGEATTTLAGK